MDAIHKSPTNLKAFVTISGVGYYKPSEELEYDENWTQSDGRNSETNFLMKLARDWEQSSELDEQKAPSTRRVVIRSGVVLGNDGGIIKNAKIPFLLGLGGPLGK